MSKLVKNLKHYEVKNLSVEVKDLDTGKRQAKIMLAHFGNIDSDMDMIMKGAFAKSIAERGPSSTSNRKVAFLRYHDWEHQIGKFLSLQETDAGLVAVVQLGNSTKGNDALLDYQDQIIREHSIGFNYISDKMQLVGEGENQYWQISEVILWEGSAVTFGANELTPVLDVSKGNKIELIDAINKQMNIFVNALKSGGTDERLFGIEMGLKVCQEKYNSLLLVEPTEIKQVTPPEPEPDKEAEAKEEYKKKFLSNLKTY